MYQLYLLARHWRWLSESTFLNDLVWSSALFLRNPVSYTELFWSQFDCFLSDLRDEVHAVYSNIPNKSDLLLNEELGTCLSDSVPWGRPLNESIYVSYGQDDPELCRRFLWRWSSGFIHCSSVFVPSLSMQPSLPTICSRACWNLKSCVVFVSLTRHWLLTRLQVLQLKLQCLPFFAGKSSDNFVLEDKETLLKNGNVSVQLQHICVWNADGTFGFITPKQMSSNWSTKQTTNTVTNSLTVLFFYFLLWNDWINSR